MTGVTDGGGFSTQRFRAEREADWAAFEVLLARLERGSTRTLTTDQLLELPVLYRAVLSSLSIARATSLDAALLDYLEGLATRGYFAVYGARASRWTRIKDFFRTRWPAAVRGVGWETVIIALLIALGMVTSMLLVMRDPAWFGAFVPEQLAGGRTPDADAKFLATTIYERQTDGLHSFATSLFTHNSQVSILSFALGVAFGVPTLMLEFYQGLSLGAMVAVFADKGLGLGFAGWLSIHGTTELFAAALSGAAGLHIGRAMLFPGDADRLTAAAAAGRRAGVVMVGVILMLLIAGLLEGIGRQLITDTATRFAIGGAMLIGWLAYFYAPRRGVAR